LLDSLNKSIIDLRHMIDRSGKETLITECVDEPPDSFALFVDGRHRFFRKHVCPLCRRSHTCRDVGCRFLCRERAQMRAAIRWFNWGISATRCRNSG
jgi:hypothetical protein